MEQHLVQTRAGNPSNFMITGERGIGKSSLLNYFKWVAEGEIPLGTEEDSESVKFLVLDTDLDADTTRIGLIRKFELAMRQALSKSEPARAFLKTAWAFLERIETAGFKIGYTSEPQNDELLFDEFAYTLSSTAARICSPDAEGVFSARYDGILILIDEADKSSATLGLGGFCKLLTERLARRGCNRVMFGLAGLDHLPNVLAQSHPSSLRLFDEISLGRLTSDEVSRVIDIGLGKAQELNGRPFAITDDARSGIIALSEGYPHFVQQFGFSAFAADSDDSIDEEDFRRGAFGPGGAMIQIGDRYYRDSFYNRIQQESYRQVLRIMADNLDGWVKKSAIRAKFKGRDTTLDNAIHALRERNIILSKEGERGIYRLQHKGFALWIKLYTEEPDLIERLPSPPSAAT